MAEMYPEKDYNKIISKNLHYFRKSKGYTQTQLGDYLGFASGNVYSKYERNESSPTYDTLIKLCNIFEIRLEDLLLDRAEITEGTRTTANILTQGERDHLDTALSKVLSYKEKPLSIEYGNLLTEFTIDETKRRATVPFQSLKTIFQNAEKSYLDVFCEQLRKELDVAEYEAILHEAAPTYKKMATTLGLDYHACMEDYQTMWDVVLKAGVRNTPFAEKIGYQEQYDEYASALPFHDFREIMFFDYFTGNNPLDLIRSEIEILRDYLKRPSYSRSDLDALQDMQIILLGDAATKDDRVSSWRYLRLEKTGRRMGGFQKNASASIQPSKWMNDEYLKMLSVSIFEGTIFTDDDPTAAYDMLSNLFIDHHGDWEKIARDINFIQIFWLDYDWITDKKHPYQDYKNFQKQLKDPEKQDSKQSSDDLKR